MSRRSSLTKHVTVYDVTHSRSTKISCLSRLTMSAAYEIPTTSGGSAVDCVLGRFGAVFYIEPVRRPQADNFQPGLATLLLAGPTGRQLFV